jgi:hypothetical protein
MSNKSNEQPPLHPFALLMEGEHRWEGLAPSAFHATIIAEEETGKRCLYFLEPSNDLVEQNQKVVPEPIIDTEATPTKDWTAQENLDNYERLEKVARQLKTQLNEKSALLGAALQRNMELIEQLRETNERTRQAVKQLEMAHQEEIRKILEIEAYKRKGLECRIEVILKHAAECLNTGFQSPIVIAKPPLNRLSLS